MPTPGYSVTSGLVAGALAHAYARHGTSARDQHVIYDVKEDGRAILRRDSVGHETSRTRYDDPPRIGQPVDVTDTRRLRLAVERFADLHMALKARARCLEELGHGDLSVPAWSVIGESLLVQMASRASWGVDGLARLDVVGGSLLSNDDGFVLAAPDAFSFEEGGRTYRVSVMKGWLNAGLVSHPFKIRCGTEGATTYDGKRRHSLTLLDRTLPDTLLAAVADRPLDEVACHPVLAGSTATVSSGANQAGPVPSILLRLKRDRMPLASPPALIDTTWLDTIKRLSA